jgi:hypothetical protein
MMKCEGCQKKLDVSLQVDGEEVEMHKFVQNMIGSTILGMVSSLKGVDHPKEIVVRINEE